LLHCSGLDSASSISLINSLNKIAQNGVNIVATLHQPRVEIFDIINCVYLLAPGGRLAYFGPAFGLHNHLEVLGYYCPANSNVSDFVMDVISGYVSPIWAKENLSVAETVKYICDTNDNKFHKAFGMKFVKKLNGGTNTQIGTGRTPSGNPTARTPSEEQRQGIDIASISLAALDSVQRVPFVSIFSIALRRQLKVYFREMRNVINSKCILVVMGVLIGNLFSTVALSSNTMPGSISSAQLAFIICVQPDLLQIFLRDTDIRLREESGGISYAPLFIGKVLGSSFDLVLSPIAFVVGYYPFIQSQATLGQYIAIFLLLNLAVAGLINFCSIAFGKQSAPVITSGLVIILWTVGGIQITKESIYSSLDGFGRFLVAISPFQSSFELQMVTELNQYSEAVSDIVKVYLDKFSYRLSHTAACIVHLILYFIISNVLALLMLLWQRDNYQYWRHFCDQYVIPVKKQVEESEWVKSMREQKRQIDESVQATFYSILTCWRSPPDVTYYSAATDPNRMSMSQDLGSVPSPVAAAAASTDDSDKETGVATVERGVEMI
jgi:hypothetical protein